MSTLATFVENTAFCTIVDEIFDKIRISDDIYKLYITLKVTKLL